MKQPTTPKSVRSSELVLRPTDATHDALRKCLRWLDACRELGWAESVMPDLESLFWTYHDSTGNKKPPNAELCNRAVENQKT